ARTFDANDDLELYPGSAAETYKMATHANATIAVLQVVIEKLLGLPTQLLEEKQRNYLVEFKNRIPPLSYREINGNIVLSPAKSWERINNTEVPQLYPVYPWGIYGLGR